MALTLTQAQLSAAIRLGDSAEENAEATRLLGYVTTEAISRNTWASAYDGCARDAIVNEAAIRLCRLSLFDHAERWPWAFLCQRREKFSGAWAILYCRIRVHRAGSTNDAVAAAQEAVGIDQQPGYRTSAVVGRLILSSRLTTARRATDTPTGWHGRAACTDQAARDAAVQAAIDVGNRGERSEATPQSEIDAHRG